jgi:uncharacterized protein
MQLNQETDTHRTRIQAYSETGVKIAGRWHSTHLLLTGEQIIENWQPGPVTELQQSDLTQLLTENPEVLILGSGPRLQFPPQKLYAELAGNKIGLEVMDTAAACRTFNILLSEDRAVVAALYIES